MRETGGLPAIACEFVVDVLPLPRRLALSLPHGSTAADALRIACETWGEAVPDPGQARLGVWGVEVRPAQPLQSGDRVEWYRALPNDPRTARRARARRAG